MSRGHTVVGSWTSLSSEAVFRAFKIFLSGEIDADTRSWVRCGWGISNGTVTVSTVVDYAQARSKPPRTQSSIAVSGDGLSWVLCNASPDIRAQLESFPAMQPGRTIRDTAIVGIVLIDSQIDHTTGLLMLREGKPLDVYCTEMVRQDLTTGNPLFNILGHYCGVNWHPIPVMPFYGMRRRGLTLHRCALAQQSAPYSPHRQAPQVGDNIGLRGGCAHWQAFSAPRARRDRSPSLALSGGVRLPAD